MSQTELLKNKEAILKVLPQHEITLKRLEKLANKNALPVVTVMGKYNHGKSRLLNELIGDDLFAVADKRETTALHLAEHEGIAWTTLSPCIQNLVLGEVPGSVRSVLLVGCIKT